MTKCTDCGRVIKPVVALDLDGTLGDYHQHFIRFAVHYLGDQPPSRNFEENCGMGLRAWRDLKLAYRQGGQKRSMPMFYGASILSKTLHKAGAEVWVTTTRPFNRLDSIDPDTQEWLRRHGIYYDYMLYDPDKYEELQQIVGDRVVAVLEDLPDQVERAVRLFGRRAVILRHNDYSNDTATRERYQGVATLPEATALITHRIGEWNGQRGH